MIIFEAKIGPKMDPGGLRKRVRTTVGNRATDLTQACVLNPRRRRPEDPKKRCGPCRETVPAGGGVCGTLAADLTRGPVLNPWIEGSGGLPGRLGREVRLRRAVLAEKGRSCFF